MGAAGSLPASASPFTIHLGTGGRTAPAGLSELSFLSVDTRTRYVADYPVEDGGKGKATHYMLRWAATTGEKGPWSKTASATIGA